MRQVRRVRRVRQAQRCEQVRRGVVAVPNQAAGRDRRARVRCRGCSAPVDLTLLGIGAIIGTGIFVLTGQAAAAHAGPAVVLSMVMAGVVSGLAALCYAELASSVPVAGSAYTYGYATLGELVAWIIGWDLVLEYALGAATVAVGWSAYVVVAAGRLRHLLPAQLLGAARDGGDDAPTAPR